VPLGDWRTVAGPPGCVTGTSYYAPLLEQMRSRRGSRKVKAGPRSINSISVKNNRVRAMACKGTSR
jgi:hypothetical protein